MGWKQKHNSISLHLSLCKYQLIFPVGFQPSCIAMGLGTYSWRRQANFKFQSQTFDSLGCFWWIVIAFNLIKFHGLMRSILVDTLEKQRRNCFHWKYFWEFTLSVHISDWNSPNRNIKINFLSQIHFIKQFQVFIDGSKENLALF